MFLNSYKCSACRLFCLLVFDRYFGMCNSLCLFFVGGGLALAALFSHLHATFPQVCSKLCCGVMERIREHPLDQLPPPPPPEPTAPPYMYTFMDNAYPLDDTYKMEYDPPETEPLRPHNSQTRI